jgi:4-amino-4-deoxy-L-arabinose transferase-like glycosyltransferase
MAKTKQADVVSGGLIERLRRPTPRARLITFLSIWALCSIYLTASAVIHGRSLLPKSHDENSYAIQTQMMARGRLWMAQHPLSDFFESFQMLATPVYASIYFPGSALMYVPGVWLALPMWVMPAIVSGLAVAMAYLLAGRLVDGLAGLIVALLLLATQWFRLNATLVMSQSPMAVLGLALLLVWIWWRQSKDLRLAAIIGACAGWAAIVRPVDALAFALPVGVAMIWDFRTMALRRALFTTVVVILAAAPFLGLQLVFNRGTTGNWLRTPHTAYLQRDQPQTTYGFHTPDPNAGPQSTLPQKRDYYAKFMAPDVRDHQLANLGPMLIQRLKLTADVVIPSKLLLVLLVAALFALRDAPRIVIAAVPVVFICLYVPYTFYMAHYLVPIMAPAAILIVVGAAEIATRIRPADFRRKLDRSLRVALALIGLASLPELNPRVADDKIFAPRTTLIRDWIARSVRAPAVVLVRYAPGDNTHDEPVYNPDVAWPDDAPVIVAHDLGPRNAELIEYYERVSPGRNYYLIDRATLTPQGPGKATDLMRAIFHASATTTTGPTAMPSR